MLPLLAAGCLVAAGAGVWWHRRTRAQRHYRAILSRLEAGYDPAEPPTEAVPLRSPRGRVAVSQEGVLVALGDNGVFRRVGWRDVGQVQAMGEGSVLIHISQVGDIAVPRTLGREIWDAVSAQAGTRV